jgi:hypothetical protein
LLLPAFFTGRTAGMLAASIDRRSPPETVLNAGIAGKVN